MSRRIFGLIALALPLTAVPLWAADAPIKVLIITGDHGHAWKETTPFLKDLLTKAGMTVDVTETPAKDLTSANLAKYDVLLLNYKDTRNGGPDTRWSAANQAAFLDAVRGGKGLVVYHHASSAFVGGRNQGIAAVPFNNTQEPSYQSCRLPSSCGAACRKQGRMGRS